MFIKKLFGFGNNDVVSSNGISSPPTNSAVDHNETTKMEGRSSLSKTTNPPTNKRVNFRDSDENDDNRKSKSRDSVFKGSKKHRTSKSRSPSHEDNAEEKRRFHMRQNFRDSDENDDKTKSKSRDSSRSPSPSREEKIIHINKLIRPVHRKNRIAAYQCLSFDKEAGLPCLRTCSSLDKIKAHLEYCRKK